MEKLAFLQNAFTSKGGCVSFDLWKHGIVEILSFSTKHYFVEPTCLCFISPSLSPLSFCGLENCGNCGIMEKVAFLLNVSTSKGRCVSFDLWKRGIVEILSFSTKHYFVETTCLCFISPSLSPLSFCGIENCGNCGIMEKLAFLQNAFT